MLPVVTELGLTSLVITYRNDEGVPQNPDGLHWFGLTEWEDLEGAVKYAVEREAEDVVLIGYSMGGGIVIKFLYESPLAEKVRSVVLDSPMLDFGATIDHGASQRSIPVVGTPIPDLIIWIAKNISSIRFGIDFDKMDYLSRMNELTAPILLFHSDADKKVPVESKDTGEDRMKGTHPEIFCQGFSNQLADTFLHLPGSLVGKGQRQYLSRCHPHMQQVGNAIGKDTGLSRTGSSNHQAGTFILFDSQLLCFVQIVQEIHHLVRSISSSQK